MIDEPVLSVNRVVELDRAWQALDADSIEAGQLAEFAALTSRLVAVTRERGDREVAIARWKADARQVLDRLRVAGTEAAAGIRDRGALAEAMTSARSVAEASPDGQDEAPLQDALTSAADGVRWRWTLNSTADVGSSTSYQQRQHRPSTRRRTPDCGRTLRTIVDSTAI